MPLSPAVFNQLLKGVRPTGGLTETEAATIPYARAVEEKKVAERNRIQPLRMLFDLLSRGQYASANMVDEIIQSIQTGEPFGQSVKDALAGVLRGLKGEEKGDYEDILRKYLPKEILEKWEKPILGEKQEGKFLIGATPIGVLGFLGNVLLDPLTWVGFGPAKGARSVSDDFAKDIIKVKLKKLGIQGTDTLNNLQKIAREGFSEEVVQKALKSAPEQAAKYLDNVGAKKVSEYLNKTYKEARKFALRKPAAELQQRMQQELSEIGMSKLPALAPEMVKGWELEELLKKTYQGAGTRAGRFMGKEFAVGVREPWHIQQWDTFTQKVAQSPPGQLFGKAIKAAADWGPVASFRKRFGIRNPYQKYLRSIELEESAPVLNRVSNSKAWEYMNFRQKYGDDVVKNVQNIIEQAEDIGIEGIDFFSLYGKTDDEMNKFATELTGMLDNIRAAEREAAAKGLFGDGTVLKSIDNYLPTKYDITEGVLQGGARKASPTATRVFTRAERVDVNAKVTSWLFGVDLEQARSLIQNHGMSNYATNLDELMMWRIYGHSKLMERANIVEQFREFGIPIDELEGAMRTATEEFRGGIQQLGLRKIDDPAYKGFVFDKDVADIIENVNKATGPGSVQEMKAIWTRWTSWWRGMVTMTTGFTSRNFLSNNATGFMKHGAKWFRIAEYDIPALVGTIYALGKDNPDALIKAANLDNAIYKRILNKRFGKYTTKELADYSLQKGVISQATMGYDAGDMAEGLLGKGKKSWSPLAELGKKGKKFVGTDIAHKMNSIIESQARFKSFLIDYSDIARTGIDETGQKAALEWAKKEAKKWFIDYTNLTDFEKRVMKNVVPFYTWLRYNIGNQVSGILSYPEMYSMFPKLQEAAKLDDPDFDPTFIPEWMKQLGMFPVSKGPEGKFRMFRPDFPFGDINKIPLLFEEGKFLPRFNLGELRDDILAATHPWIKQTFEVLVSKEGYDTFYKSQMPPTRRVPLALRVVAKFPRATQFLDGLLRSRGREGGLYINEDDKGKLHIDSKVGKIIEENMPLFKTLENIMLLGSAAIPGLEQLFEEKLDIKDDYEDLEHTFQVLSRWAGIKFKEADWQKEKELLRKEIYNEANEQRLKAMGTTPSAQLRSKQRKETLEKKMRRVVGF